MDNRFTESGLIFDRAIVNNCQVFKETLVLFGTQRLRKTPLKDCSHKNLSLSWVLVDREKIVGVKIQAAENHVHIILLSKWLIK